MCRQDIDPEKTVDKAAVDHEKDNAGDEECPGILSEPARKGYADLENSIEHEGFCNTVGESEYQNSEYIKLAASVCC